MKTKLHPAVLFRIPQFPIDAQLKDCWEELKASISISSPDFFHIIKDLKAEDIGGQSIAVQATVFKYFNRARFRSTPYGTFASWGMCRASAQDRTLIVSSKAETVSFSDWSESTEASELWKEYPMEELLFLANSSWYKVGQSIRYIYRESRGFELSDVAHNPLFSDILTLCAEARTFAYLKSETRQARISDATLRSILRDLVDIQLLFTDRHPNIIGQDYFCRTGYHARPAKPSYIITGVPRISGSFDHPAIKELERLIPVLHSHMPTATGKGELQSFFDRFQKKYDRQAIPIMLALDPELGIGYNGLECSLSTSELIRDIEASKLDRKNDLSDVDGLLKNALLSGSAERAVQFDDLGLSKADRPDALPNTITALVSNAGDKLVVEQLGGATANAILGRFTLAKDLLLSNCRELAGIEQTANPDVLFFDIGYMGEVAVDNVNRRAEIYTYSLSILNYDTSAEPLSLTDLYLFVQEGELILYSRKLKRRLIPRISTAYNYTRSDLSVFRLLCDMQFQGIQASLLPDLERSVPGLKYYPRLEHGNIILSVAKWKLEYEERFTDLDVFNEYLKDLNLPGYVKIGFADQTLILDLQVQFELYVLQTILKKNKTVWAKEGFAGQKCMVADDHGKGYASEFVLSFTHEDTVYRGALVPAPGCAVATRTFVPGSDWLYWQIFVHPDRTEEVLSVIYEKVILPNEQALLLFFFIRYDEGGEHLRIRVQLKDRKYITAILMAMENELSAFVNESLIADIRLCTYERELERYGSSLIEQVEAHFGLDSRFALACIIFGYGRETVYPLTIKLMLETAEALFSPQQMMDLFARFSSMHNTEHKVNGPEFKKINREFKLIRDRMEADVPEEVTDLYNILSASFVHTVKQHVPERRRQLFADLFHMHINRVFSIHQRVHEMIIYNYLVKLIRLIKV